MNSIRKGKKKRRKENKKRRQRRRNLKKVQRGGVYWTKLEPTSKKIANK